MKKHIILVCEGKQQFGLIVDELSAHKVIKNIVGDLKIPNKPFICLTDYAPDKDPNQELGIKSSVVNAVILADVPSNSNIQIPRPVFRPGGRPN